MSVEVAVMVIERKGVARNNNKTRTLAGQCEEERKDGPQSSRAVLIWIKGVSVGCIYLRFLKGALGEAVLSGTCY